jgi:hypothetical protein
MKLHDPWSFGGRKVGSPVSLHALTDLISQLPNQPTQGWQSVGSIRFPDPIPTEISGIGSSSDPKIYSNSQIRIGSSPQLFKSRSDRSPLQVLPGKSRSECMVRSGCPTFNVKWDQPLNDLRRIISHFTSSHEEQ